MSSNTALLDLGRTAACEPGTAADGTAELVVRARRGDTAAFEALLVRHERTVFGTAWRLLGSTEDAEDAAQEVFLRLYRFLDRVDPERPLAAWLYRVTVNVCRDLGRKRKARETLPLEDARKLAAADPASDPAAGAALGEERRMVAEGLETLTRKERAALVLRDLEGLETSEVAKILESSEVTVRTHVCRARMKLKRFRDRRLGKRQDGRKQP